MGMLQNTPQLYDRLRTYREKLNLPWFDRAWDLNLFIMRDRTVGTFGDWVFLACLDDAGKPVVQSAEAAGDAWAGEWKNPTHPQGCIYTLNGHYPGGMEIGKHKGRPALRQRKNFRYVRWPSSKGTIPSVRELEARAAAGYDFEANRGTHLHNRASLRSPAVPGKDDTEGCTLIRHQHQHAAIMQLAHQQLYFRGSPVVSPTYGHLRDLRVI